VAGVRRLSLDLRPSMLDDLGLVPALRWLAERSSRDTGIETRVAVEREERYSAPIETVCFRVAQEALTNVARHAEATSVRVELRRDDGRLRLEVRDDGCGFDAEAALAAARAGASLGLAGMRERVALVGGELRIAARPGAGCAIVATIPLPAPDSGAPVEGAG
jgi:signal transduction histidine kinase